MKKNKARNISWIITGILVLSVISVFATTIIDDTRITTTMLNPKNFSIDDGKSKDHSYSGPFQIFKNFDNSSASTSYRGLMSEIGYNGTENSGTYYNALYAGSEMLSNKNLSDIFPDAGLIAIQGNVHHKGNGIVSAGQVIRTRCNNEWTGELTSCSNIYIVGGKNTANGTYTNEYGVYMDSTSNATNTFPLFLKDNGTSFINGSLGIGTNTPTNKLTIDTTTSSPNDGEVIEIRYSSSSSSFTTDAGPIFIKNQADVNNQIAKITFTDSNVQATGFLGAQYTDTTNNYGELFFWTRGSTTGLSEKMRITSDGMLNLTYGPLRIVPNSTAMTCSSATAGAIYYNGVTYKHYGCNSTTWNALY